MAKVAWPVQEAKRILKAAKSGSNSFVFETGYGPSGLPHIGTFAEVVRTLFVIQALRALKPDAEIKLVVFSDDMDGLRNLPENVPNHDLLRPHLGAPLSTIPDPFGEKESFAGYMNGQLCLFLDSFGFEYEFHSSTECYKAGVFDDGLKKIMENYDKIRNIFTQTISEEKRAAWSPFFPICESCGKIYSTRVTDVDLENYRLSYHCDQDGKLFKSCGHQSTVDITGGHVKVGWKVDWALRWYVLGVNYEMYGKDLMESATVSSKICRILGGSAPVPYKYELFLDENGAKISKKIGNGLSMAQWMRYAPFEALLNFLLGNPNKAKKMGLPLLPRLIDEYLQLLRTQTSSEENSPLWFLAQIQHQELKDVPAISSEIGFSLLYNVADSLSISDANLLYDYAVRYDSSVEQSEDFFRKLCGNVVSLVEDLQGEQSPKNLKINEEFLPYLVLIHEKLETVEEDSFDGNEMQKFLFALAKENEMNQREWFGFLYAVLLGKEQGPKIGPFFAILGKQKALTLVQGAIKEYVAKA